MDAEQLLRLYLEQRREMGERELVLDDLSVEEVLRIVGARGRTAPGRDSRDGSAAGRGAEAPSGSPRETTAPSPNQDVDWRAALRAAGAGGGKPLTTRSRSPAPESTPTASAAMPSSPTAASPDAEALPFEDGLRVVDTLERLAVLVRECQRCPLYHSALNPVPGEGNPAAGFMCVGEAPGAAEDHTGRPFVGPAGQLLTKILAAVNLRREDVFIANVLKHRPPANRNPEPAEVKACRPYLVRQIELIRPRVILALGTFAAQSLLETKLPISRLRGTVHSFSGFPVVVTYHPAALLRNPSWKRPAWEDVQLAHRIFDSPGA